MGSTNQGLLLVSAIWITLLLWGEIRHTSWLQGRAAAVLASFSLVAANVIAKTLLNTPDFGIGVLDLIYAKCIVLSFLGVAFTKFHPDKPMVVPYDAQQGVRALSVGFFRVPVPCWFWVAYLWGLLRQYCWQYLCSPAWRLSGSSSCATRAI